MYHSFTPGGWCAISPATLRWHLELIRDLYEVVPLSRLVAHLANGEPTEREVALTVDDGYEDFITVAYPILSELRLPATLFVPTGHIGGRNDWEEPPRACLRVASAAELGWLDPALVTLGSHSVHHRALRGAAPAALDSEVRQSKMDLEAITGIPVTLFSHPFGDRKSYSAETIRALHAAGFVGAVTSRWGTYSSPRELLALPRISFSESDSRDDVRTKLAGDWDWITARQLTAHAVRSMRWRSTR